MLSFPLKRTYKTMTERLYHKIIKVFTEYLSVLNLMFRNNTQNYLESLSEKKQKSLMKKKKNRP